jgi:hypothetical protein
MDNYFNYFDKIIENMNEEEFCQLLLESGLRE